MQTGKSDSKSRRRSKQQPRGVGVPRHFTQAGVDPFDTVEWELRDARITDERGETVFEQTAVEMPKAWSQLATNVVVSKYFRGHVGTPEREHSVKQLIGRVVGRLVEWGEKSHYFKTSEDRDAYRDELKYILVTQRMAFNSPVWFNLGVDDTPQQASACFINSVDDTMSSIMDLAKIEAMLFKGGSGAGSNLSKIRSSKEQLAGGGVASGPVSFMKGFDAFAGVIKSGGKTRRAAKMVILDADHPDIMDFVNSKAGEEKKAWALIDKGYDGGFNVPGGAYDSVYFQNANHSVRVTDDFMHAVLANSDWTTTEVLSGKPSDTLRARDILTAMAEATHLCGDPGIQYDTTINRWNPVKNTGRINASNPCSEYMFLDDTACNLASLNLMTFLGEDGSFDVEAYKAAVDITILGQEIMVDHAAYPTPAIEKNSYLYRPLGLGYANLGALLMTAGLPYDSDQGRNVAAALTALMCGQAYLRSAQIAEAMGPFAKYKANRKPFLEVIGMHKAAVDAIPDEGVQVDLLEAARSSWAGALDAGSRHGFKNGQVTVLAPTGTIAFMMDCDTTGVEPDIALVKYKKLVGGGMLKIVNNTVPMALAQIGYPQDEVEAIVAYINEKETIEGAPHLAGEHLAIFDCAFRAQNGSRSIDWRGHVRMMGAVQPFLSGAISKTVNLPHDATVADVAAAYLEGWKLGLKALAVYRDGSKRTQPLNAGASSESGQPASTGERPVRKKLPDERAALTHKFSIAGHEGYLTVGLYDDGTPGEIFLRMAKEGSTVSGLMDTIATMTSISLQYGVPLKALVDKFSHTRFEPSGFTNNREIPIAKSVMDYVFRFLGNRFLKGEPQVPDEQDSVTEAAGVHTDAEAPVVAGGSGGASVSAYVMVNQADAPSCCDCGSIMIRNGACYKCPNCGNTSGCS
jgi:ribonucleoside-diphosphate reductase alpha chain